MQTTNTSTDPFHRNIDALDANFGQAPNRRAAHAKGVVTFGTFIPTPEASSISRAGHFAGPVDVVVRLSNFPGGRSHPDAAPECNPRGLAVQFRLTDGSTTDLLAHSIDGFPGRTVDDFSDFLEAIAPNGPGPQAYLADHPAASAFVHAIQTHGTPASYAGVSYFAVNAFIFHDADDQTCAGRYTWMPTVSARFLSDTEIASASPDFLAIELAERLAVQAVEFTLVLQIANPTDATNDANATWPDDRSRITLGTLRLTRCADNSAVVEQGLFFDPVRLVDGITLSDDPLLIGRTRTYPLSLGRRHE
jgi:catalase